MSPRLVRLGSLIAGYVALLLLDRSWQVLEERAIADAQATALASLEDDELEPADLSDVIAAHDCVCCRSGAASWPVGAPFGGAA